MKALSSMAMRHLLSDLIQAAIGVGIPSADLESIGGVEAFERISSGERFDLVFLSADAIEKLAASGHLAPTRLPIAVSQVAVAEASPTDRGVDVSDRAAFEHAGALKAALISARRIAYSTGPSGTAFLRMLEDWGLREALNDRLVQARPGIPVAELLARGSADLGLQQLSELVGHPGVRVLGVMPPDCAIETVFMGAISQASMHPAAAHALLAYMVSPDAAKIKADHHFAPPRA